MVLKRNWYAVSREPCPLCKCGVDLSFHSKENSVMGIFAKQVNYPKIPVLLGKNFCKTGI